MSFRAGRADQAYIRRVWKRKKKWKMIEKVRTRTHPHRDGRCRRMIL